MQENPTVNMDERDPRFIRNMPNSQGSHHVTNMECPQDVEAIEKYCTLEKTVKGCGRL